MRTSCTSCASLGSSGFRTGSLRRIQILMSLKGSEASTPAFFPPTVFITAANSTTTAANSTTNDQCHKQQYHSASRSAQPPFLQYNFIQFYLASTIAHFHKQHSKLSRSAHHCHQFHTSRTHMVPGNGLYAASLSFLSFFLGNAAVSHSMTKHFHSVTLHSVTLHCTTLMTSSITHKQQ